MSVRLAIVSLALLFGAAFVAAGGARAQSAAPSAAQQATIVNSGSTNTAGYTIDVRSDGTASAAVHAHLGNAPQSKDFKLDASLAQHFFADAQAAKKANEPGQSCMKSASFGTSLHVEYDGWTSPDFSCPPAGAANVALAADVAAVTKAANIGGALHPPMHGPMMPGQGPPAAEASP